MAILCADKTEAPQAGRGIARFSARFSASSTFHLHRMEFPLILPLIDRPLRRGHSYLRALPRRISFVGHGNKASIEPGARSSIGSGPVRSEKQNRRWWHRSVPVVLLVSSALVVASCNAGVQARSQRGIPKVAGHASARDSAILAGWKASLEAFDAAARTMDWSSPAVAATHVQPQRGIAVRNLWLEHWAHYISIGNDSIVWTEVHPESAHTAKVIACVNGNEITVYEATRKPVPGVLGESGHGGYNATMVQTPTGWKLERQLFSTSCPSR
jgi:hypothetical protein